MKFVGKIPDFYKIRGLQYFFLIITVLGLVFLGWEWIVGGLVAYAILETLGGNIALHRYYGHRSFKTTPTWDKCLCVLGHYVGVGSVVSWVGQHRYHHANSDTDKDIHSPYHMSLSKIFFGIWDVNTTIPLRYVRDVVKQKPLMKWHVHYWKFHLLLIVFYLIIDLFFGTFLIFSLYAMPNLLCLMSGYALATITHAHGYRAYDLGDDKATNSWIGNIFTLGEGWHNNHHHSPTKYRQGEQWWEWDLPAFVIERVLKR